MRRLFLALLLPLLITACGDEIVSNKYSSLPARFSFTPVNSISQLLAACNSPGEWCTVTLSNNILYFQNTATTGQANLTALSGYTGFYMGLCGFLVGLPNMPELGADYAVVNCYDLACSNCYVKSSVTRKLTLQEGGYAHCAKCQRTYNLNNVGIVASGEAGIPLYRYRVYYGNNTLAIDNR